MISAELHKAPSAPWPAATWKGCAGLLMDLADGALRRDGVHAMAHLVYGSNDWSLVGTCIHEAGHAAVARAAGFAAAITINRPGDGICHFWGADRRRHARELQLIGLAGNVVTQIAIYGRSAGQASVVRALLWPGVLSDTDAMLAGEFGADDAKACADLVCDLWASICHEARTVLADSLARFAQ